MAQSKRDPVKHNHRTKRYKHRDEDGVALLVAIAVAFVVVLLSTAAITQSVSGLYQSGIAGKQVDSTDAAEAGLQYEVSQMNAAVLAGSSSFACSSTLVGTTSGAFSSSSSLYENALPGTPSTVSAASLQAGLTPCTTGSSVPLVAGDTYLISSTGTTTAKTTGTKTEESEIYVPPNETYQPGSFTQALFAGADFAGSGSFSLSGGDTYSGFISGCASSLQFGGNYYTNGLSVNGALLPSGLLPASLNLSLPTVFGGACAISNNLYVNNGLGVALTQGSSVGGSVYSATSSLGLGGAVSVSGGAGVSGSIWSEGPVTLTAGAYGGSVYSGSAGGVTLCSLLVSCGVTVAGNVYSNGPVVIGGGTVTGNVYANGAVTVTGGATVKGTIYSSGGFSDLNGSVGTVENSGGTVSYTAGQKATGPLYETGSINVPWLGYQGPTAVYTSLPADYAAANLGGIGTTVTSTVAAAMITAANNTNATPSGTTATVNLPSLTYDQTAWLDNVNTAASGTTPAHSGFCPQTTPCTACPVTSVTAVCGSGTVRLVTDNDCNVEKTVGSTAQLDPASVWAYIASMETSGAAPTVIQTDCRYDWGDSSDPNEGSFSYLESGPIKLYNNLAIFDTAGFTVASSSGGFASADGNTHQLYLISPSTPNAPFNGASLAAADLLNTTSFPTGVTTCNLLYAPDISVQAPLTDGHIDDFLYTPSNVCSYGGNATILGKVYAGGLVLTTSNWQQTFNAISPWVGVPATQASPGGTTTAGTPVVQWTRQVANPPGTS